MIEKGAAARLAPAPVVLAAPVLGYVLPQQERAGLLAAGGGLLAVAALLRPTVALVALMGVSLLAAMGTRSSSVSLTAALVIALPLACRVVLTAGRLRPAHLWIGLLAGALFISYRFPAFGSMRDPTAICDIAGLLIGLALLAVVSMAAPRPGVIARAIALTGIVIAGYAWAFGDQVGGRLEALGYNPNYLGGLLAPPCVAAIGLAGLTRRPGWLVPATACLVAMAQTQSRGAFISAAAGVAIVLIQGRTIRPRTLVAVAGVALALYGGGLGLIERLAAGGRHPAELAHDTAVRTDVADFAVTVAARHPIRGIGLGTFASYAAAAPEFGVYMVTHDDYLRLAAEAGAVALVAFLALLWLGTRKRRLGDLAVLRAVTVAYAVGLVFANPLVNLVASLPFWLSLGCLLAAVPAREPPPGPSGHAREPAESRIAMTIATRKEDHQDDRQPDGYPFR